jgi:hypothetical protein
VKERIREREGAREMIEREEMCLKESTHSCICDCLDLRFLQEKKYRTNYTLVIKNRRSKVSNWGFLAEKHESWR